MSKLALKGGTKISAELENIRWPELHAEDEASVLDALRKNYLGGIGDENLPNNIFEREFARYHGAKYGIAVANGTVALELSLRAGGVQPGDEVIVPAITFIASATPIISVGAVPIFVDVDPDTAQISVLAVEAAITHKTRAIIGVHYGGYAFDLDAILDLARRHNLLVIEDSAHAHGTDWRGKKVGSWGSFGCFSFQQSKALAAGEGGIVLTNDDELFEYATLLRNIGRKTDQREYYHYVSASNWRMGGLQGALLLSQFSRFPRQAKERDKNGRYVASEINKIPGLRTLKPDDRITQRGYYFMVLEFDAEQFGTDRDKFVAALQAEGVGWVGRGYERPLYKEPAFSKEKLNPLLHPAIDIPDYNNMSLPNAEKWARRQVTIGHTYLLGEERRRAELVLAAIHKIRENVAELNG